MKSFTRQIVRNREKHLRHIPIGNHLWALAVVGIILSGMMNSTLQAGTVVRFELNYPSEEVGVLNYFDVELYDTEAPVTVANFVKYVNNGLYDNTIIHRSMQDFVMQGGGFSPLVENGSINALLPIQTYAPIVNEFSSSRSNTLATVAMAKVGGDADSATSQWFVNLGDNSANLDNQNSGFTVFGKVIGQGMTLINGAEGINSLQAEDLTSYFGDTFSDVPVFNDYNSIVTVTGASVISESAGQLSGSVYVDMNKNGIMDGDDYAIAGSKVSITLDGQDAPSAVVYSDSDGSYNFTGLGSGSYSVKMETPNALPSQDSGAGRIVADPSENILSVGAAGAVQENTYSDVWLGDAQSGTNFNFAQEAYPVALISARMLLNSDPGIPKSEIIAIPGTNTTDGSVHNIGYILMGEQGSADLTVSNLGNVGSSVSGEFFGVSGKFSSAGNATYGPLDAGESASHEYTFTPAQRGTETQDISLIRNNENLTVTLSGTGVAPVQEVLADAADAGYVRIGATADSIITVNNIGDGNLSGLGDESNLNGSISAGTESFIGDVADISMYDNESKAFSYTFTPQAHGPDSATIALDFINGSDDGMNIGQTVNVDIAGYGVGPEFSSDIAPDSILDFGDVPQADTKSLFLEVSNITADPDGGDTTLTDLTLISALITGDDAELFSVEGFTAGTVLHAGDSLSVEIAYNGTGEHGDRAAVLTIVTDEGAVYGMDGNGFVWQIEASLQPEPGSLVLLAIAGLVIGGITWRRRTGKDN